MQQEEVEYLKVVVDVVVGLVVVVDIIVVVDLVVAAGVEVVREVVVVSEWGPDGVVLPKTLSQDERSCGGPGPAATAKATAHAKAVAKAAP